MMLDMTMKFDWILFDLDDTLFHFDSFTGIKRMFAAWDIPFTTEDFKAYQQVNKKLWLEYQDGKIDAAALRHNRFASWSQTLNRTTQEINRHYFTAITEISTLLPGARELVESLAAANTQLGIVTNGFTELQTARLDRMGLSRYFSPLVISEQVGVAKPSAGIFEHALTLMNNPAKDRVLMVGDNLHSDILGGIHAGIKTCWLNADQQDQVPDIQPDHQVSSLHELKALLL